MKKLLACLLILCLISAIICACGKGSGESTDNVTTVDSSSDSITDDTPSSDLGGSDDSSDLGGEDDSSSSESEETEKPIPDISGESVSPNPDEDGKVSKYY